MYKLQIMNTTQTQKLCNNKRDEAEKIENVCFSFMKNNAFI